MTPTQLLLSWRSAGTRDAFDALVSALYPELEHLARGAMRGERPSHTLQTHALLHEAYVRLIDARVDWQDRAHFLAIAARTMRRVLVDYARGRHRAKRDGGIRVTLTRYDVGAASPIVDVLALNEAIDRLAVQDDRQARIAELHFFGGLTVAEVAEALGVSLSTVERDLRVGRAWLRRELAAPPD